MLILHGLNFVKYTCFFGFSVFDGAKVHRLPYAGNLFHTELAKPITELA